ncbi:nucleotidyl transferase AbiEii/AbiGii toxin family protein [Schaalia cardiffensis]|uniref:nucleotidyl transferase AbiEii/AbiGii toxin family protein n=1 Tax=Schaalia cardiffensis TaxID=181487 RepID=UPI0023F45320|nr:nucleotidyl transferase AbiEii/AbiGii toxin family protein [Schaalia cardiffensis]
MKRLIATVIVGQMLPNGVAKGGNALKIRFGKDVTRFSRDLDTARASSLEEYVSRLEDSLTEGWSGFTGIIVPKEPASPRGVPAAYVMRPFDIKLAYNGKSWMTLPLEVGHNEIGDAEDPDMVSSPEVATILKELGLPEPAPVPCMRLEHQIAQKLHALSGVGSERAHDLIDLQIAVTGGNLDYLEARKICVRLFEYRQEQGWPPTLVKEEGWESLYGAQAQGLSVLPSVDDAVDWANSLVAKIEASV